MSKQVADALRDTLISPNEMDSNWENANVVDVIGKAARGIWALSKTAKISMLIQLCVRRGDSQALAKIERALEKDLSEWLESSK